MGDDSAPCAVCGRSRTDTERFNALGVGKGLGLGADPKICSLAPRLWLGSVGLLSASEMGLGVAGGDGV